MKPCKFTYIGKKSCGCCVAAVGDYEEMKKDVAESVAEMIEDGLTVTRIPCLELPDMGCSCKSENALL